MRQFRFYLNFTPSIGAAVIDNLPTVHYIAHVLRLKIGTPIILFDGKGFEFNAQITAINKKQISVLVTSKQLGLPESRLKTHLGQVISRGEKMDFVLQKACELGVSQITPLFSERCEIKLSGARLNSKISHWQQVLISASEQSKRSILPKLNSPQEIQTWLKECTSATKIMLQPNGQSLRQIAPPNTLALVIGGEGGFSAAEIALAKQHNFIAASLGPRILRTETAPIAALAIAQQLWGDF